MKRAMTEIPSDPRALLRAAIAERCEKNPQYSIRAFARSSGISHTVLSLVLSGKRKLSKKATLKLANFLELDPTSTKKLLAHDGAVSEEDDSQTLSLDAFDVISDWYHYAILSALELPQAEFDARWMSRQLGITVTEAKLAMDRLQRLGLVEQKKNKKWKQTGAPIKVNNSSSTAATRKFHRQLLSRASEALDSVPFEQRSFTSMTFAVDPSLVPYAMERIKKFRRELVADLEAKGSAGAVFNLAVQLFPVSQINQTEKKK